MWDLQVNPCSTKGIKLMKTFGIILREMAILSFYCSVDF